MPSHSDMELRTETTRLSPAETAKYLLLCKIVSREKSRGESLESRSNAGPRQIAIILSESEGPQNSAYRCLQKMRIPCPKRGIFFCINFKILPYPLLLNYSFPKNRQQPPKHICCLCRVRRSSEMIQAAHSFLYKLLSYLPQSKSCLWESSYLSSRNNICRVFQK